MILAKILFFRSTKKLALEYHFFVNISSGRQRQTNLLVLASPCFLEAVTFSFTAKVGIGSVFSIKWWLF